MMMALVSIATSCESDGVVKDSEPPSHSSPLLDLVSSNGYVRGALISETTVTFPSTTVAGTFDLVAYPGSSGPVLLEVTGTIQLEAGTVPLTELLDPGYVQYYRANGDAYRRPMQFHFRKVSAGGSTAYMPPPSLVATDSIVLVDDSASSHGIRVDWSANPEQPSGWNANDPPDPNQCRGILISFLCYQAPAFGPGRVSTQVPTGTIRVRAYSTTPAVAVSCSPNPVMRGAVTNCQATVPPGVTLSVSEWRFVSSQLPTPIVRQSSSTLWSGIAAVSGEVRVSGQVNGTLSTVSSSLTVTARNWTSDTVLFQVQEVTPSGLPVYPDSVGKLGNAENIADVLAPPGSWSEIQSGPNTGLLFFGSVPVQAISRIRINRVALAVNSSFYKLQFINTPPMCLQQDVVPFLPLVEAHEGLHLESSSHAGVFRQQLNLRVPQTTEAAVGRNLQELEANASTYALPAIEISRQMARDQQNGGTVPPVPYCNFRYFQSGL